MDAARTNKVFLVDDAPGIRSRIAQMLRDAPRIAIVGEADTPSSAIDGILRTLPQIVVLDVHLSGGKGIDVLRRVHASNPEIVFIVLTNSSDAQYRKLYLAGGASHFLDKSTEFERLKPLIAARFGQSSGADLGNN